MAASQASDELSYDEIMNLPFMDAVYRETLRVYVILLRLLWCKLQSLTQVLTVIRLYIQ